MKWQKVWAFFDVGVERTPELVPLLMVKRGSSAGAFLFFAVYFYVLIGPAIAEMLFAGRGVILGCLLLVLPLLLACLFVCLTYASLTPLLNLAARPDAVKSWLAERECATLCALGFAGALALLALFHITGLLTILVGLVFVVMFLLFISGA